MSNNVCNAAIYEPDYIGTATYSPEDNKLRITPFSRLDAEIYAEVKAAGYRWAPKQGIFVAPMWTPSRYDLAVKLCGNVGDEDTSLTERAEDRAERFEGYSENRAKDAEQAKKSVDVIAGNIPFGQPILVGHHSERHARRDAKRIENGMRKAVNMWETSEYWKFRAAGALRHAKYKEKPEVRARRIKGLEADKRKQERNKAESSKALALWSADGLTLERALSIAGYNHMSFCFTLDKFPRNPPVSQYEGSMGVWSALDHGIITANQAQSLVVPNYKRNIAWAERWIEHYSNRLAYEHAMLDEQGATELLAKKPRSKAATLPLCNYSVATGLDIPNMYHRGEMVHYPMHHMTKAEFAAINKDYKGTRVVGNSHRVRTAMIRDSEDGLKLCVIFLTDSKTHEPPFAVDPEPPKDDGAAAIRRAEEYRKREIARQEEKVKSADFTAMKESLRAGVQIVAAPQLFPTPHDLAARMVDELDIQANDTVLEPSAGTGNLLQAVMNDNTAKHVVAVEINYTLAERLRREYPLTHVHNMDFLQYERPQWKVDRIIMNPPFQNGDDIKHIKHALTMLKEGGRLVALCANGPRQRDQLMPLCQLWEDLPAGSFSEAGTNVNVALLVIEG